MIRIVVPVQGIFRDVSPNRIELPIVPDDPLIVVSLPYWPHEGKVLRGDVAADRALETANY